MKKPFWYWFAVWFGAGLIPFSRGTWGSLFSLILWGPLLLFAKTHYHPFCTPAGWFFALIPVYGFGAISVRVAEPLLGLRENWRGDWVRHDQSEIVIDEVFGMGITMVPLLFMPFESWWWALGLSFGLFRLFDITKPPGVKFFDEKESAEGVMLDDGVAGFYASIVLVAVWFGVKHFLGHGF